MVKEELDMLVNIVQCQARGITASDMGLKGAEPCIEQEHILSKFKRFEQHHSLTQDTIIYSIVFLPNGLHHSSTVPPVIWQVRR